MCVCVCLCLCVCVCVCVCVYTARAAFAVGSAVPASVSKNHRQTMNEYGQKSRQSVEYKLVRRSSGGSFICSCYVGGVVMGSAEDRTIRGAEEGAAYEAWVNLSQRGVLDPH